MDTEGVFRRSPNSSQLKECKALIDSPDASPGIWDRYDMPVHIAAVLIKMYLRDLPSPLFPNEVYPYVNDMANCEDSETEVQRNGRMFLDALPVPNRSLFVFRKRSFVEPFLCKRLHLFIF
jgi:hypothetical protein